MLHRAAWRMGLQVSLFVGAIVVLLCGVAVAVVLNNQVAAGNALLDQTVSRADDVNDPPAGVWLAMLGPSGQVATTQGTPAGLPDTVALEQVAHTGRAETKVIDLPDGNTFLVRTQLAGPDVAQAILNLGPDAAERHRLLLIMLVSGGTGLLLAAGVGVWSSWRAVRPMAAALALQRQFVADASHEIRTPLTLLSTRAQLLRRTVREDCDAARLTGEIDGLVNDAHHLTDVLDDLLLSLDIRAEKHLIDLVEVTRQVVAATGPTAAEQAVQVGLQTGNRPVLVRGSRAGLRRALTALLDNALQHAHSTVTVSITVRSPNIDVTVTDDGPGIDPAILPHVFERFASTGNPTAPGARRRYGLGLALVGDIAARHGGTVSATNTPNAGATLGMTLPASASRKGRRPA